MNDELGAELIAFGPLIMRRADVYLLVLEQGMSKRAADFFAFSPKAATGGVPTAIDEARQIFEIGGTNAR